MITHNNAMDVHVDGRLCSRIPFLPLLFVHFRLMCFSVTPRDNGHFLGKYLSEMLEPGGASGRCFLSLMFFLSNTFALDVGGSTVRATDAQRNFSKIEKRNPV